MPKNIYPAALKELRGDRTGADMARALDVPPPNISRLESTGKPPLVLRYLRELARGGVSWDDIGAAIEQALDGPKRLRKRKADG